MSDSAEVTAAVEKALADLRRRVDDAIPPCYLYESQHVFWESVGVTPVVCLDFIGGTFPNGAEWTLAACCDPCRISHALHEGESSDA